MLRLFNLKVNSCEGKSLMTAAPPTATVEVLINQNECGTIIQELNRFSYGLACSVRTPPSVWHWYGTVNFRHDLKRPNSLKHEQAPSRQFFGNPKLFRCKILMFFSFLFYHFHWNRNNNERVKKDWLGWSIIAPWFHEACIPPPAKKHRARLEYKRRERG